MGLLYLLPL
jgi:hypothetical protein